jgi:LCP family protein required for cell wall assembly
VLAVLVATADLIAINGRIKHVHVRFPHDGSGTTYVIVGSDSRTAIPTGASHATFGSPSAVPGQHADVVLVVHQVGSETSILSIPRDTLVSPVDGTFERLTLAFNNGPQAVVDGLCRTLHITANHFVIVNFLSFAEIVNELGGVTVNLPHPVRDPKADLYLDESGVVHLDGTEALALVRSRNPQWLIAGTWTTVPNGSTQRTLWAGKVFESVLHSARQIGIDPVKVQELAWAASGSLTTDGGTGLSSLWSLSRARGPVESLTESPLANTLAVEPNRSTFAMLASAGYGNKCVPG